MRSLAPNRQIKEPDNCEGSKGEYYSKQKIEHGMSQKVREGKKGRGNDFPKRLVCASAGNDGQTKTHSSPLDRFLIDF